MNHDSIRRVGFVTSRFHELRGLIPATFGGGLILFSYLASLDRVGVLSPFSMVMVLISANAVHGLAQIHLDRGYRTTFGDAVATVLQKMSAGLLPILLMVAGLCDAYGPRLVGAPSVMALVFAVYSLWIVVRDWPWRVHYLAALAAGLAAAAVTAVTPEAARAAAWMVAVTLVGLGMMAGGLADHHLLATSLIGSGTPASIGHRKPRRLERALIGLLLIAAGAFMIAESGGGAARFLYPAVLILVLALGTTMIVAIPAAVRAIVEFNRDCRVTPPSGPMVDLRIEVLAGIFAVGAAAGIETVVRVPGLMMFAAATVSALHVRHRGNRVRDALVAIVLVVFGVWGRHAASPNAFPMLVIAAGLVTLLHLGKATWSPTARS